MGWIIALFLWFLAFMAGLITGSVWVGLGLFLATLLLMDDNA